MTAAGSGAGSHSALLREVLRLRTWLRYIGQFERLALVALQGDEPPREEPASYDDAAEAVRGLDEDEKGISAADTLGGHQQDEEPASQESDR
jgi:hypothetical protein